METAAIGPERGRAQCSTCSDRRGSGHAARIIDLSRLTHLGSRLCTAAFETIGFGEERRRGAREIVQVMNFAPSMTLGEASAPKPQPKVQRWNSSAAF